jgi:hypothetical protein
LEGEVIMKSLKTLALGVGLCALVLAAPLAAQQGI